MEVFTKTFFSEKHNDVGNVPYYFHASKTDKVKQFP